MAKPRERTRWIGPPEAGVPRPAVHGGPGRSSLARPGLGEPGRLRRDRRPPARGRSQEGLRRRPHGDRPDDRPRRLGARRSVR